ncbi:hypothetical protein [Acidiphilium multivorum]|uniref:hypothetical protein n=1 Tax=Acidiphilium multivorum TaxID=62140 RepID=UPI0039C919D6
MVSAVFMRNFPRPAFAPGFLSAANYAPRDRNLRAKSGFCPDRNGLPIAARGGAARPSRCPRAAWIAKFYCAEDEAARMPRRIITET